ncbi:hypothetical protein BDB00DRAFT_451067 [Zychaea mexicana]|uniref:uncharacterized protein n=1 Tax=Zychaea mexicana TaxID=64656 RepID=UPI0022FDE2BD|nr:uncharacterized protein BDB00DRAFT_451067 [Zychaea mexicana]KAI9498493.1 hypothetical protein BDB00DRAFT_451067 [Zychaea mexicana]
MYYYCMRLLLNNSLLYRVRLFALLSVKQMKQQKRQQRKTSSALNRLRAHLCRCYQLVVAGDLITSRRCHPCHHRCRRAAIIPGNAGFPVPLPVLQKHHLSSCHQTHPYHRPPCSRTLRSIRPRPAMTRKRAPYSIDRTIIIIITSTIRCCVHRLRQTQPTLYISPQHFSRK